MASHSAASSTEARHDPRDEVHYRARARCAAGAAMTLLVVNTSTGGMMARSNAEHRPGDRLAVTLPVVGTLAADVRWSLGGRIGCQFERAIAPADYYALLGALR